MRVYDPATATAQPFAYLIDAKDTVIGSNVLLLLPQSVDSASPGYAAILDIAGAFPQLAAVDRFDIRVTPLIDGMEYWALASVTDQDTQTVMLVTANP